MTHYRTVPLRVVGWLVLASAALGQLACAANGADADCPTMPVTDDPFDPELVAWREEAEAKGCVAPHGEPIE